MFGNLIHTVTNNVAIYIEQNKKEHEENQKEHEMIKKAIGM